MYSVEFVKSLYKKLPSEAAVAKELGVSRQFMFEYRVRHNIIYDPYEKRMNRYEKSFGERDKAIIDKYKQGWNTLDLAREFGLTRSSINRIIGRKGVQRNRISPCSERNKKIYEMRKNGKMPAEIALEFNMSRQQVCNILYKMSNKIEV